MCPPSTGPLESNFDSQERSIRTRPCWLESAISCRGPRMRRALIRCARKQKLLAVVADCNHCNRCNRSLVSELFKGTGRRECNFQPRDWTVLLPCKRLASSNWAARTLLLPPACSCRLRWGPLSEASARPLGQARVSPARALIWVRNRANNNKFRELPCEQD